MSLFAELFKHIHLSETKDTIVRNLFWAVAGKIVNLLGGLLVGIIVARYLGPEQYGLMNYVISYVFLFQTFALFGLDSIEIREEAKGHIPYQTVIGTAFWLKAVFGICFIIIAVSTSWLMEANSYTTLLVAIYSLSIVLNSTIVIRNYFTSIVQNEYVVKAEISRTVIGIFIKLALLMTNASLTLFVTAYMFDFVLLGTGYIAAYRYKVGALREWHFDKECAKYLLHESFPLLLTNAAVIIYQRIDQVMIGNMIDKSSVGYFSVAARFTEVLIFLPMILAQTITPILVKARERNMEEYKSKAQQFMDISFWLSLAVSAVVSMLAYWLIRYTFGTAYLPAVAILQVMAFKAASVALSNTAGAMLITEGLQRYAILRDGFGCIVCVLLNYLLLPRYGIMAAAFVSIASNIAAGYLADAIVPAYRHLFVCQTKTLLLGWKEVIHVKQIFR
ncbi:MAG: flippase [Prevotella sp.]|nr:flippase [Prevotella sp.]